ncbi:DUF5677 domain-containing protein [Clostridioides difficile]|nr:DUF5677 domain-containing protein [Clostridioides difficile]
MVEDYTNDLILDTIKDIVEKKIEDGEDENKIIEFLNSQEISKIGVEIIKILSDISIETIETIMYEKVFEERTYTNEFLAKQERKWGKAFVASEAMYICVLESAETYTKYVLEMIKEVGDEINVFNAIMNIHARACQEYKEILCLNRHGFADGAYARWRSMYELSVISEFIVKNGSEVAIAFLDAADTEDRYEWARSASSFKHLPSKKYITFSMIQKECQLSSTEWKSEYNLANQLVHASPQGTIYRLGNKFDVSNTLSVGHSDYGMTIPAVQSAISLALITSDFFSIFEHRDTLNAMLTFNKWIKKIEEYYEDVEKNCFNNEYDYEDIKK